MKHIAVSPSSGSAEWERESGGEALLPPILRLDGRLPIIGVFIVLHDLFTGGGTLLKRHSPLFRRRRRRWPNRTP